MRSTIVKLTAIAFAACLAGTAGAAAPSNLDELKVSVDFSGLDVSSPAGAREFYSRMQAASARACDLQSYRAHGSLDRYATAKACYADTLDKLVSKADNAHVDALHSS